MDRSKILTSVIILLAIALGIYWIQSYQHRPQAMEFAGRTDHVDGNNIYTRGVYVNPKNVETDKPIEADMVISVDQNTKYIKVTQFLPTAAELEASGGMYEPAKLKSEEGEGSLQDIADEVTDGIFAKSDRNIYGKAGFTASEIKYYVRVQP